MTRVDMVRIAVEEFGDAATTEQIAKFVVERFRMDLGVMFIPVYRATLRAEEHLRSARAMAATLLAEDRAEQPVRRKPPRRQSTLLNKGSE